MGKPHDQDQPWRWQVSSPLVRPKQGGAQGHLAWPRLVRKVAQTEKSGSAPRSLGRHPGGRQEILPMGSLVLISSDPDIGNLTENTHDNSHSAAHAPSTEAHVLPTGPARQGQDTELWDHPGGRRAWDSRCTGQGRGWPRLANDCSAHRVWMDPREAQELLCPGGCPGGLGGGRAVRRH